MEHMEDAASHNEDDVRHANEDIDDHEIGENHDNEDDCAISRDHEVMMVMLMWIKASVPLSMDIPIVH